MLSFVLLWMGCDFVEQWNKDPELVVVSKEEPKQGVDRKSSNADRKRSGKKRAPEVKKSSPTTGLYYAEPSESPTTIVKKSSFLRAITSRDIPVKQAERVVREHQRELQSCAAGFKGRARSELLIEQGGSVTMVEIKAEAPHKVELCLQEKLYDLNFASPVAQRSKIHLSFRF